MTEDVTWRLYRAEWLIVYTSDQTGQDGKAECRAAYARKYGGRVRPEDVRVVPAIMGRLGGDGPHCVQLRLPNLKGEFKNPEDALALGQELAAAGSTCDLVRRGSPEEQALLDYGKKMLPDAG